MTEKIDVFKTLSSVDVSNHIDVIRMKKGPALKYVSWSWAWSMIKSQYPDTPTPKFTKYPEMIMTTKQEACQTKYGNKEYTRYRTVVVKHELTGREVPYLNTPTGTMVECTITIADHDYTESLYVMDNANNAVINPTMQQINKTQKRCMVKCLAMAGLGLNLYAGEDLPMGDINSNDQQQAEKKAANNKQQVELEKAKKQYRGLITKASNVLGISPQDVENTAKETAKEGLKNKSLTKIQKWKEMNKLVEGMINSTLNGGDQQDMFEEAN
ncbi:DUF1071 domain-containing protein [uncultured Limosilactobacillus sp.]|uniref:Sak single strand annealing protein n=1 Tax=uncultured Limosilactobacillus sp. TaxID=2837629 RepID=UPI0025CB9307|nr:DUF1071 domain-containing protein [uncultured Limosilactobacillus sp.]